jgi:hypothetical protein
MVKLLPMYVCASPRMRVPLFTFAQEVEEVAVSSGVAKIDGFISLRGSRTKESIFSAYAHVRN